MIEYDTSQYPTGALGWHALLQAIEYASSADESDWIEFKANLDLTQKTARPVLAKAIVAFANRDVARAARHLDGRALVVIGLEPGNVVGAPLIDPADLHDAIQPYLAAPAPAWDVQYVLYETKQILVITVNAPQLGDPIHCIAKEGERVRDGDVYVRNVGQSAPAKSADLRMLSTRLLAQAGPGLEVDVCADAGDGIPQFDYRPDWIDRWIEAERDHLLAPLAPPPAETSTDRRLAEGDLGALGLSGSFRNQFAGAARFAASTANLFLTHHEEDRTEEAYASEVEEYLDRCRMRLPRAVQTLRIALSPAVMFQAHNLTEVNFRELEVHVHVEGDVTAFAGHAEYRGLSTYTPRPPRTWGPWTENRIPGISTPAYGYLLPQTSTIPYNPTPGPTIVNGGSADITFQPLDLRPGAHEHLHDGIFLLAGPGLDSDIICTWTATATNMNGRAKGTFTIPVRKRPVELNEYLCHGSGVRTGDRDDPGNNVVLAEDWDD